MFADGAMRRQYLSSGLRHLDVPISADALAL
jgi:hypothetical protein